jgi:hypothetical protein
MSAPSRRGRRSRGIALADFMTGTLVLAGAVTAWAAITRAQIDAATFSDRRAHARDAALSALDLARVEGVASAGSLSVAPDKNGFRLWRTFPVAGLPGASQPAGRLEVRPLVVDGAASSSGALEARATVTWHAEHDTTESYEVSTALPGGDR